MLKGIPKILSPELLKVLAEMGHSDRLVISDGNFPSESMGKNCIVIRCDGHGVPELLDAILQVFPLDTYVEKYDMKFDFTDKFTYDTKGCKECNYTGFSGRIAAFEAERFQRKNSDFRGSIKVNRWKSSINH